jgi:iron complex outermembrane recepter protein
LGKLFGIPPINRIKEENGTMVLKKNSDVSCCWGRYRFYAARLSFLLAGIIFFTCSQPALAAAENKGLHKLDDVVVSATKMETELKDISTNITVIPKKDIERYEARDISDLLRQIPGFYIAPSAYGVRADAQVSSRGNEPSSRGMIIMVNGIEFNNAGGYFNLLKIPIKDIERIEVIKSPTSALYGNQATGGVVNVITRTAKKPLEVMVGGAYGSFETKKAYAVLNGKQDNWEYYFETHYLDTDGYQDNGWEEYKNYYGKLKYRLDETSSVELHANFTPIDNGYPGPLSLEQFEANNRQTNQPQGIDNSNTALGALVYKKHFGSSELLAKMKYDTQFDCWFIDAGAWFEAEDHIVIPEINYTIYHNIAGMQNSILLGAEYRDYKGETKLYAETDGIRGALTQDRDSSDAMWGLFIQDELKITDNLTVSLGARYDSYEMDMQDKVTPSSNYDISDSALSPSVGITYIFSDAATVFTNYSSGFRKPSSTAFTQNRNLKPETLDSYEVGLRGRPVSWFNYNMALFLIDTKDKVIRITGSVPFIYENAGETRSYGAELGAGVDFKNGVYGSLNYTCQNSEFREYTLKSGKSYNDKELPRIPKQLFGFAVGYRNDLVGNLGTTFNAVGSKYFDNDNNREWDSYYVWNARYSKRFKTWNPNVEFFISGENLSDEKYVEVGWAGNGWEELYVTPGRSFIGGVDFYF